MKNMLHCAVTLMVTLFIHLTPCYSNELESNGAKMSLNFFTSNGPSYFLVVEKSSQQLSLYQHDQELTLIRKFSSATGETPGTKAFSGDSRTPEGIYFITEVYEDNKITVFGSRAFHLDYPNVFDKHSGHRGDGIFIHGTNKTLEPFSTNGCITLDNKDLDELAPYLAVNSIPVIIVDKIEQPVESVTHLLTKNDAELNNIIDTLDVQSTEFIKENISTSSLIIVGHQAVASIAYKVFDKNSMQYLYKKRVYLTPTSEANLRPLYGVHYQEVIPKILAVLPVKTKFVARVTTKAPSKFARGNELIKFVEKWRNAWTSKDIETYISCYSPTFTSGKLNINEWKQKKSHLNQKYNFIQVNIRNIIVEWTNAGADVSFFQSYQSDKYETSGKKLLKLVYNENKWLIQKEIM